MNPQTHVVFMNLGRGERAGRTRRRSNTPDYPTPTPGGEQTVMYGTAEPLDKKE
jgi:hypothetical protein